MSWLSISTSWQIMIPLCNSLLTVGWIVSFMWMNRMMGTAKITNWAHSTGVCQVDIFESRQIHLFRWASRQVPVAIIPNDGHTPRLAPLTPTQPTRPTPPGLVQPNGAKSNKICKFFLKGWNFGHNQGRREIVTTSTGKKWSKSEGFRRFQFTKGVSLKGLSLQIPLLRVKH